MAAFPRLLLGLLSFVLFAFVLGSPISSPDSPRDGQVKAREAGALAGDNELVLAPLPTWTTPPVRPTRPVLTPIPLESTPAPVPTRRAIDIEPPIKANPQKGCTTTSYESWVYPCSWSGTQTIYPTTTTLYKEVNCNGCENIIIWKDYSSCPNMVINKTERVNTASTYWSTICKPTALFAKRTAVDDIPAVQTPNIHNIGGSQDQVPIPAAAQITPFPKPVVELRSPSDGHGEGGHLQPDVCQTTLVLQPPQSAGKTSTKYSRYTTTTLSVNCSGCTSLVVSTALAGYGPPGVFTTTTTLPVGAVTAYACRT
ncbi:uncharacterized protein PODANS_3_2280 [Podospora anserina S mat+]|uniref:Podospora anserina S mat+ genomic DNA chromosome 3, supercontig 2 n=1 Tax=Podospora anserina (strain S / ATCC MYA-4624 / DSM 980 / FGSC 10383) TaxID=515849 RepID=B2B007_PODAN|nr:uncharacterized protein PODANS_3_2280 [Podospora anserina S mat+]CAP70125.1 unnamed protein product [Podospora anserina S mat+]CDP26718.1 Putative protein of unknown function [Podospora anserina S mat+]